MSELQRQFGKLLKVERDRRKFNISDISIELKITEDNLIAIEEGDASALPSDLYYRLFAKSYSEYLGIDFARTMEAMSQDIIELPAESSDKTSGDDEESQTGKLSDDKSTNQDNSEDRSFVKLAIILSSVTIVIFTIFLVSYNIFWSNSESNQTIDSENQRNRSSSHATNQQISTNNSYEDYNWSYPTYETPDSLVLVFTPSEPSWAAVFADGDTAIYQTLKPGSIYRRAAKYRFIVSVGVPRVVDIKLNGRPIRLAPRPGVRITKVEINQTNYHELINQNQGETDLKNGTNGS